MIASGSGNSPFFFTINFSWDGKMLTIKAYSSNLESKLLIAVAKIWRGDV